MIVENVDIYSLVPSQIMELIEKLNVALNVIKERKQTPSLVSQYEKGIISCPHCNSINIRKNGHRKQDHVQMYECKDCKKGFNALTDSVFANSHLTYEKLEIFVQCFHDKLSIRNTAKRMDVDKNTVYFLREKLMDSLKEIRENTKLNGEVESDEIYRSINLKGTKTENMPRFSKARQSKGTSTRGISKHKVCIASAIDENDNMFLEIVGTGPITSDMIKKSLVPKIGRIDKLITDCKSSYESVSGDNNWTLIQIKSKTYSNEFGDSLANINSLHSGLTTFLSRFRGVSTKHLQGYLDWYIFDKMLCYKTDNNKVILQSLIKKVFTGSTNISYKTMNNNYSGINFDVVYSDYN